MSSSFLTSTAEEDTGNNIMIFKWFPWKRLTRWVARRHGFLDPVGVLGALERFAQPSEVSSPIELVRAGVVFHARGLMNTKAIQHNLDWVWPYWVQRQFDPEDPAFLPRAFSISHVNLTHRNWTAVGLPGCNALPIIDPRGLLTPFYDGWSLTAWIIADDGNELLPPTQPNAVQRLLIKEEGLAVQTVCADALFRLTSDAFVEIEDKKPLLRLRCIAESKREGWLVVALRPFNPEGVSFVHDIELSEDRIRWTVDKAPCVTFDRPVEKHLCSNYHSGDVHLKIRSREESTQCLCRVGMATAAAMYRLNADGPTQLAVSVDLSQDKDSAPIFPAAHPERWKDVLSGAATLRVPDRRVQFLFDAAVRNLVLHCPLDVYPGPYTYKRFWFRDAALILHAMLCAGLTLRARRVIDRFRKRQKVDGFFHSQSGEWDSNGEALWIMHRYAQLSGARVPVDWRSSVHNAARWIIRKRCPVKKDVLHSGLLPAGFSAEHLGNNDFYYWDDFWSVAGLRSAAAMCRYWKDEKDARHFEEQAVDLMHAIDISLEKSKSIRDYHGIPASPYRRMDAGAIGSIVAGYPLNLLDPRDPRLLGTIDWLMSNSMLKGAFFQDMIHSGMNPYLTLHMAQVLLRAGDTHFQDLVRVVAELASPTGQWPEAVHPRTGGGCMGDGQHIWAAAEWVMMIRNMFIREEGERLELLTGVPAEWLAPNSVGSFGPAPTPWGPVTVSAEGHADGITIRWTCDFNGPVPLMRFAPEGFEARSIQGSDKGELHLVWSESAEAT